MKRIGWLLFVLYSSNALAAGEIEIPLLAETAHLQMAISRIFEFDEQGKSMISNDPCNHVALSEMQVVTDAPQLSVSMALTATTGAYVLGACRGPKPWQGRFALKLTPQVMPSGLAIAFVPDSIELSNPDGSSGLLNKPVQFIADALVLPRMKRIQIDLTKPLSELDGLVEQALGPARVAGERQPLIQRTHITRLQTEDAGVRAWLALQVSAPEVVEHKPEPRFDASEMAEWQTLEDELDGFLTTIISALANSTNSQALRLELLATLLDARYAISKALLSDDTETDPVRELFLTTWERLVPLMRELESLETPGLEVDYRLAAFIAGGDVLRALDALGPEYGLEINRDGLRRLARLLLAEKAPQSFTPLPLEVDPEFRDLFGFDAKNEAELPAPQLQRPVDDEGGWLSAWLWSTAHADTLSPVEALKGLAPTPENLESYLELVDRLLQEQASVWLAENEGIPDRVSKRLDPLVRATAWKESCWRQLIESNGELQVLRSATGAVGMMQINGRVWRKVYNLDRLVDEVDYNVNAGIEILTHYMIDYALRRGEHEQPGGDDNLVKATYAAYNGGPGQLTRYRREDTPARLQAIDNEFWRQYTTIKDEQWPDISSCYTVVN